MSEKDIGILNKWPATTGFLDRVSIALATVGAGILIQKLHLDPSLIPIPIISDFINEIMVALIGLLILAVAKWQNRAVNLAEQVVAVTPPGTQVVTEEKVAEASNSTAIVSKEENKVVRS